MERIENLCWVKSSFSGNGGNCVEVGQAAGNPVVGIRDTKRREAGHLAVTREAFGALLAAARSGALDLDLDARGGQRAARTPGRS
jgi:Domain of unknown function (DUF397)